jgi:DNA invertase Pin-like site-specific DNA recombinase
LLSILQALHEKGIGLFLHQQGLDTSRRRRAFIVSELGPNVDPFMLHIHAAVAEQERRRIGERNGGGGLMCGVESTWSFMWTARKERSPP